MTHLATNGAGVIHDWEFAYQGASSEDVQEYLREGRFGLWEETGRWLSLALLVGAFEGRGYGESVGALVHHDGLTIPDRRELLACLAVAEQDPLRAAAAADLLWALQRFPLAPGFAPLPHRLQAFRAPGRGLPSRRYHTPPTPCSVTTSSTRTPSISAPP